MGDWWAIACRATLDQGSGSPSATRLSKACMTKPLLAILLLLSLSVSAEGASGPKTGIDVWLEVFWTLFLDAAAAAVPIGLIWLLYWLWKSIVGSLNIDGEVADAVYTTGSGDTHTLLKVIITILFPPLLLLWIWKLLFGVDHVA